MSRADLDRLVTLASEPLDFVVGDDSGTTMAMESAFAASEGNVPPLAHCRICLSIGQVTTLRFRDDAGSLSGMWRPGRFTVSMPGISAEIAVGPMRAIGLAIDLDATELLGTIVARDDLLRAGQVFGEDPLITSVLVALRHEAEVHGASTAFFEHGVSLIFSRLAAMNGRPVVRGQPLPLAPVKRRKVDELIANSLGVDLDVATMADAAGMSKGAFSRAWHATTGYPPYAYLTRARMAHAHCLLRAGCSVTNAAMAVGYRNPAKFAEAFRRCHGMLPSRAIAH